MAHQQKKTMGPTCWSLSILSIMRCSFRSLHNSTKVALSLKGVKHKQLHPHDEDTTFLTALMSKLGTTKEDSLHRFFPGLRMAVDLVAGTGTKVAGPPSSSLSVVTSSNFLMGNKTKRYKIHLKNKSKIYTDFVKSVLGKSSPYYLGKSSTERVGSVGGFSDKPRSWQSCFCGPNTMHKGMQQTVCFCFHGAIEVIW